MQESEEAAEDDAVPEANVSQARKRKAPKTSRSSGVRRKKRRTTTKRRKKTTRKKTTRKKTTRKTCRRRPKTISVVKVAKDGTKVVVKKRRRRRKIKRRKTTKQKVCLYHPTLCRTNFLSVLNIFYLFLLITGLFVKFAISEQNLCTGLFCELSFCISKPL